MSGRAHTVLLLLIALAVNALFFGNLAQRSMPERAPAPAADAEDIPRLAIIGIDGLDWTLLRGYLDTHGDELPAFRRLAKEGAFQPLEPEMPPESPVSWASLLTGVNPAKHRVLDFIIPTRDYQPVNGMVELKRARLLFDKVPVRGPRLRPRLAAPTFIERIRYAGYGTLSLRQPLLFPAPDQPGGRWLAGLGTPDVAGTSGYPTAYSNATGFVEGSTTFGTYRKRLEGGAATKVFESVLMGPFDPSAGRDARGARRRARAPVRFERIADEQGQRVRVRIGDAEVDIEVGERTALLPVEFTLGTLPRVHVPGIVRFELRQFEPLVVLSSPVMADPANPVFAITSPPDYASELQQRYGNFETVGWQEETFPLNDRLQDDRGFLADVLEDIERGAGLLLGEMGRGDPLVFNVITGMDRACHAFWRYRDVRHPLHGEVEKTLGDPLLTVLKAIDRVLGQVHSKLSPRDTLLVVSDHGFQTWRYGVNVNQWLMDEGYLVLKGEVDHKTLDHVFAGMRGTDAVDWSKTRAFAMGLGQIYINSRSRFDEGIVDEADAPALARELQQRLLAMRNPYAGISEAAEGLEAEPLRRAILLRETWKGPYIDEVADIQLAFARGYRISWQTVLLGDMGAGREVCVENRAPWSGDHCSTDSALVPGVVLCNHPIPGDAGVRPWNVKDICATALAHFGLDLAPLEGEGQPIPIVPRR